MRTRSRTTKTRRVSTKRRKKHYAPQEGVIVYYDSTFSTLDLSFDPSAEYAGCRLCGAVYQSPQDRKVRHHVLAGDLSVQKNAITQEVYLIGDSEYMQVYDEAYSKRQRWRELHRRRYHTVQEVENFSKTGFALTPEAAHRLAPYGFAPTGNMHTDIVHALATAPRAPLEDTEGR